MSATVFGLLSRSSHRNSQHSQCWGVILYLQKLVCVNFYGFIMASIIFQVSEQQIFPGIRVPQEISDQLLLEMETSILEVLEEEENNETHIRDIFLKCYLLSNVLYGYFFTRFVTLLSSSISLVITMVPRLWCLFFPNRSGIM
jgi:hypothetical protein